MTCHPGKLVELESELGRDVIHAVQESTSGQDAHDLETDQGGRQMFKSRTSGRVDDNQARRRRRHRSSETRRLMLINRTEALVDVSTTWRSQETRSRLIDLWTDHAVLSVFRFVSKTLHFNRLCPLKDYLPLCVYIESTLVSSTNRSLVICAFPNSIICSVASFCHDIAPFGL